MKLKTKKLKKRGKKQGRPIEASKPRLIFETCNL